MFLFRCLTFESLRALICSRSFRRKCTTLTVASFFRQWLVFFVSSRSVHFFVHLFNIINLNYQNILETPEPRPKQKHRRPEPRKHRIPPLVFFTLIFFRHYATHFEVFWIPLKGLPFVCFDILQHSGCQKIPKGPPFYIFRHCDTVQNSH